MPEKKELAVTEEKVVEIETERLKSFEIPRSMFSLRLKLNMPGIDYFRMESGKICEVWIFAENQAAADSYRLLTCIKRCDMFYMTK